MIWEDLLQVMDRAGLPISERQRAYFLGLMKPLPCLVAVTAVLCLTGVARAASDDAFDFETLRYRAKVLSSAPYVAPESRVPEWLLKLTYDQHRMIRFIPDRSWWRRDHLPFQLQFFHPGFLFNRTVQISEVDHGRPELIAFDPKMFDYGPLETGPLPPTMGFAGFRMLYALNKPNDELGAFQGASYFRMLCQKAVYGLSARGIAINTAEPGGEEFPAFTDFWIERPARDAKSITLYALLDGPERGGGVPFRRSPPVRTRS